MIPSRLHVHEGNKLFCFNYLSGVDQLSCFFFLFLCLCLLESTTPWIFLSCVFCPNIFCSVKSASAWICRPPIFLPLWPWQDGISWHLETNGLPEGLSGSEKPVGSKGGYHRGGADERAAEKLCWQQVLRQGDGHTCSYTLAAPRPSKPFWNLLKQWPLYPQACQVLLLLVLPQRTWFHDH